MKRKKDKVVQTKRQPYTPLQFLYLVDEQWGLFNDTTDNEDRMGHLMNTVTLMFMYLVSRYDHENYLKYMNKEEEEKSNGWKQ